MKGAGLVCAGELDALQEAIGTGSTDQAEMLGRLLARASRLDTALAEARTSQRLLHNQLVELRGNVRLPGPTHAHSHVACSLAAACSSGRQAVQGYNA